ncbi:hypothetical protein LA262_004626 [Vibrio parahaemolyticus]|nr:hypothetical protein [Vibrio parahaemolyticus]
MGRLTSEEEYEYNKRVSRFVSAYRKSRGQHSFSPQNIFALAAQYGLSNNNSNKPIDTKTLSALLKRQHPRVISAEEWRRTRTIRFYDYLLRHGTSPKDAKKYLSERFSSDDHHVTVSSITKVLNRNGRVTYSPKSKAIAITKNAQRIFESGQTIHELIKETDSTVQELKKYIKSVKPELFRAMTDSWFDTTRTIFFRDLEKLTPENCQLWGLIWADGSITYNPRNGHYNIFFALDSRIAFQLKTWLDKTLKANTHLRDDKSIKRLSVSTTRYVVALCLWMERASTINLKRKTTLMKNAYHHIHGKYGLHHEGFEQVKTLTDDHFLDMINTLIA